MTFVDIHIVQSVPPSNINRDDTGSPKSAIYGGVRRSRVSSQAWKRATRKRFNATLDRSEIGFRSKMVVDLLIARLKEMDNSLADDEAVTLATEAFSAAKIVLEKPKVAKGAPLDLDRSKYLLFLSAGQLHNLARASLDARQAGGSIEAKRAKEAVNSAHSFDVALFGRMVADDAELNVDAAAQVAHALSVHAVEPEFDYFTAVDDQREEDKETGAGMIGTVEFNSATLYRYATVNIEGLNKNLGDRAATARAAAAFVESLVLSMPTGKVNTFANRTVPEAVVVSIREDQPINLVGAFESPVVAGAGQSVTVRAAAALAERHAEVSAAYGPPSATWVVSIGGTTTSLGDLGSRVPMTDLPGLVEAEVLVRLGADA